MSELERIPVLYDFASTICFVAHRVFERMTDDLRSIGVALEWRPIDLSILGGWSRGVPVDGPRRENALRVARELDVEVTMPGAWLDSREAHGVAFALAGTPKEAAWRERVWSAIFEEGRDVGDPAELGRLGDDLAIDVSRLAGAAGLESLRASTQAAAGMGITGAPALVLGEYPISGIQEPETMLDLLRRYVSRPPR